MTYQQKTNELFNLEATGEGATYKLQADKRVWDDIISAADIGT